MSIETATGDSAYHEEEVKVVGAEVGEVAHGERGDKEHTRIQFVFIKDIG